jgi:hypothetical protein
VTVMVVILAALMAGTIGGILAGVLAGWWFTRRTSSVSPFSPDPVTLDPDVDDRIGQAASEWARSHNQPEAAPFVANKLRLFYSLRERHRRGRDRGWSW